MNFIVGCTVFKWLINSWSGLVPCGHIRKISSMNLFHSVGCREYVYTYFCSNFVINKLECEDASFVPMTVPDL